MKIFIETMGCPKNQNDSQMFAGALELDGHSIIDTVDDADAVIVNTCGFIEAAKKESIQAIINNIHEDKKLIVTGCLSQRYAGELYNEIPEVDLFIGVNDYDKLPELIKNISNERDYKVSTYTREEDIILNNDKFKNRKLDQNQYTATLKIAEGCDNRCTYCIIPEIRGPYRSRMMEDILSEAKHLAKSGIKELILIAQDLTAYGIDIYGKACLSELLNKLCEIDDIKWIRLLYAYEDNIDEELVDTIATQDKICKYIDIPLQHISDNILKRMNRKSTKKSILDKIQLLRSRIPDLVIRTTFIVGFPGETEDDFDELMDFVEKQRFERVGVFKYSREEGTPAFNMKSQIDEETKDKRLDKIMFLQMGIANENNQKLIDKELEVIIDYITDDNVFIGRTKFDAPDIDNEVVINTKKEHNVGDILKVKVIDAFDYDIVVEEI
ncbi:MAG: 30S ribosomal protein S12 methylthiotransferase RimO [Eubacteriales bacterium]|nr:30S ribosomal protein S12 methylthiotransferase RimO [Eubacteriales bacterium]MDY3332925.1 30S ribosomal protein S12 methylthiotransferase RimO [Gallibacter sp.]